MIDQTPQIVDMGLNVAKTDVFSKIYPDLNRLILKRGTPVASRNGKTIEVLNFKTEILRPSLRCVGGHHRDINIFFLLAEALWIWSGRKDVGFLTIFNSNMANFSDNGETFHAPYGYRLRNWGIESDSKIKKDDSNRHALRGIDQIAETLQLMVDEPGTRRAVMSIWNPDLDLNVKSKDLPCNDLVFLQESDNEIHMTISNRSNDLHWGLPTNVFQFSWILETICLILGKKAGTQVHNSKSLHIYTDNEIAQRMLESTSKSDLYDHCVPMYMDFQFMEQDRENVRARIHELDAVVNLILYNLEGVSKSDKHQYFIPPSSAFLSLVEHVLYIYILYTKSGRKDEDKMVALHRLDELATVVDFVVLAKNWFISKIKDQLLRDKARNQMHNDVLGSL